MEYKTRGIRVVTRNGKYYFANCRLDDEGGVEKIIEVVELKGKNVKELRSMVEDIVESLTLPVIVMNACSMRLLVDDE